MISKKLSTIMNSKTHLISFCFFLIPFLNACGFQPIYSEKNYLNDNNNYYAVLNSENSREVSSVFNEVFMKSNDETVYKIEVQINERLIPLVINNDGTVSKYKIEIYSSFDLVNINSAELIHSNSSRGFNSYNVESSEYNTGENKKIALQQATREALQILITKIQNHLAKII